MGTWVVSSQLAGYWGSNYAYDAERRSSSKVRWTPELQEAGAYAVYARWTSHTSRTRNARYVVQHEGGTSEVTVNQRQNGGEWVLLGTYTFGAGTTGCVDLYGSTDGVVCADAVKWVPVE
jgi:hypothetical protein